LKRLKFGIFRYENNRKKIKCKKIYNFCINYVLDNKKENKKLNLFSN